MTITDLKAQLQAELPELLKQDAGFRHWLEQLIRQTAVTPESFDARFERMLQEFAADRADQRQKWDEQDRKWREWSAVSALAASADALPRSGKPEADAPRSRNDRAAPTGRGEFSHKL